jgi:hypothetical protein
MPLSDFTTIQPRIASLKKIWAEELTETNRRRQVRYANDSVLKLRREGKIKEHETYIPRRIADSNIRREQPPRINYISQSRDLAKFRPITALLKPIEPLEREFTEFGQYPGWQMPLFQTVDGASTHGWDAIEILFDKDKPGHFQNRHITHEYCWFAPDIIDIQEAPIVIVVYGATLPQLDEYAESFQFNKAQVEQVRKKLETQEDKADSKLPLYKIYYKEKGLVYVGWHCEDCSDWLKTPEKLYLGIVEDGVQQFEKQYPIKVLRYMISENEPITEARGRVFYDEHDQEALTQCTTALVNRLIVASWILFSRKEPNESPNPSEAQTEIKLRNGAILDPGQFFSVDGPDPGLFSAIMHLLNLNANETNQVNFAAMNRQDSRKTAKEMGIAETQAAALSAVDVMLLSLFLQDVFTADWRIMRSQMLQGKLKSAMPDWLEYYEGEYMLVPSGDSDVIRRQEINQAMKQDWPVIQNTGAAQLFLADLLRASPYAENAEKYIDAMARADKKDQLIVGMKNALTTMLFGPDGKPKQETAHLVQQFAPQLKELQAAYEAAMNPQETQQQQEPASEQQQAA